MVNMRKVLMDTSVVVDYLRRTDKEKCIFSKIRGVEDMVMSFVSVVELYSGKSSKQERPRKLIEEIVDSCEVVYIDLETAADAGMLRRDCQLSLGDSFVAQLALEEGLELATLDKKAFSRVPGIKFYGVEGKRKGE